MSISVSTIKDQASGLRELFHAQTVSAHVVTCPVRPALVLPLVQMICSSLAETHVVAWIDEIDLNAREQWPLPASLRFDLGQALEGHVDLSQAMHAIKPRLFYALSCKTRHIKAMDRHLQQRLMSSGVAFDALLVAAHPDVNPLHYASSVHHLVISGTDRIGLQQTLNWMIKVQRLRAPAASWSVILAGDPAQTDEARNWLESHAENQLAQPIQILVGPAALRPSIHLTQAWVGQPEWMASLQHLVLSH